MKIARSSTVILPAVLSLILLSACDSGNSRSESQPQQQPQPQQQQGGGGFGGGGFGGGGGGGGFRGGTRSNAPPAVEVVRAIIGSLPLEERITGRVIARNQTEIFPEASGLITAIYVENGDVVKAGDPLVRLRDAEFQERYQQSLSGLEIARAQSAQARANLELVRGQAERTETLVARSLDSGVSLENIRSQLAIAQADLDLRVAQENQARSLVEERLVQLQNATIRAPISGTVGQRNAEVGQLAGANTRLFVIGDLSEMRIELMLSDRMLDYIGVGVPVNVTSTSWEGKSLSSSISRISPFLDVNTMRTQAFVEMENPQNLLRPGMFVTVDILYGQSEAAVLVPNAALYRDPRTGIEGIWVVASGDGNELASNQQEAEGMGIIGPVQPVQFIAVQTIASGRMATAVRGINEGDIVVTLGQHLLQGTTPQARPRLLPWDHMMKLQDLQSEDMFEIIEQQRVAMPAKS